MAIGKKTGGKDFVKGQVSPPGGGRPRVPPEIKEAMGLNKARMLEVLNKFLTWNGNDLGNFLRDPNSPALELIVVKIIVEAIKRGDERRLNFLFDRCVGKVEDKVKFTGRINLNSAIVEKIQEIEQRNKEKEE